MLKGAAEADEGITRTVVFGKYTHLSSSEELASRFLSPLTAAHVARSLTRAGAVLND